VKIKLTVNRRKINNEIYETFFINPLNYCFDNKRIIYYALWFLINNISLHKKGFTLKEIRKYNNTIIYKYEYTEIKIDKLFETYDSC
jgi:hypothetical protein